METWLPTTTAGNDDDEQQTAREVLKSPQTQFSKPAIMLKCRLAPTANETIPGSKAYWCTSILPKWRPGRRRCSDPGGVKQQKEEKSRPGHRVQGKCKGFIVSEHPRRTVFRDVRPQARTQNFAGILRRQMCGCFFFAVKGGGRPYPQTHDKWGRTVACADQVFQESPGVRISMGSLAMMVLFKGTGVHYGTKCDHNRLYGGRRSRRSASDDDDDSCHCQVTCFMDGLAGK